MHKITRIEVQKEYRISLSFADGTTGVVDLSELVGRGVFAGWRDYSEFCRVRIGDAGELVWPGDVDLCPDALYLRVTGKSAEDIFPALHQELANA